jgi:hypothetical protein
VSNGDAAAGQMRSLLEAGYTTVLAGGGQADANVALRDRIDKGEFIGPRIIASGQINIRQTPPSVRTLHATSAWPIRSGRSRRASSPTSS